MPFKSEAQKNYMHAKHPEVAKKWAKKYGIEKQPDSPWMHMSTGEKKKGK